MINIRVDSCKHLLASYRELPFRFLGQEEQARISSFTSARRRLQFLAGRLLVRQMLCDKFGGGLSDWQMDAPEFGKPRLLQWPNIECSISHSGDNIACAISTKPVGIDLKVIRAKRDLPSLFENISHPTEFPAFHALPANRQMHRFLRDWTLKEAWLKCEGLGLDLGLMRNLRAEAADSAANSWLAESAHAPLVLALVSSTNDSLGEPVIASGYAWRISHWNMRLIHK